MVKIRLTKTGRKNAPSYRLVATDSKKARDGKYIEALGFYNPSHNPELFEYDKKRYEYWLSVGAKPTESVQKLIEGKYEFIKYDPKAIEEAKNKAKEESEKTDTPQEQEGEAKKEDTKDDKQATEKETKEETKEEKTDKKPQ